MGTSEGQKPSSRMILGIIMGVLAVWAAYIAIGAYAYSRNPWGGLIVLASMAIFIGFWLLLLWNQQRGRQR